MNRRESLRALSAFLAGSPLIEAQRDAVRDHTRVPGINELKTTFEFEAVEYAKQPRTAYDYQAYGVDGEFTMRRNREAYDWVQLVPRRMAAVDAVKTEISLFGQKMPFPIIVSPTGSQGLVHPDGDQAMHRGATAANATMAVSNNSSFPFEKVAAAAAGPLWVQLYPKQQLDLNQSYLENAQAAGAKAVIVTIDQQASVYERSLHDRNLGGRGGGGRALNSAVSSNPYRLSGARLWYEWKFFDEIRPFVKVPMLAKGILTAEDARLCLEHGCDGVYVSNHGGRSLDYDPSTLEVLPEIVQAVGGRVPVIFDGGLRRGADVVKALALGASAVCLGRVPLWGLGSYGDAGVKRVLEIMQAEFVEAMKYTGCATVAAIDKRVVETNFP